MDEQSFGKGAIPDVPDKRDYKYEDVAMSLPPFDWTIGFDIEEVLGIKLKVKNQNGSGSCGGQAWGYYGQVLDPDFEEKSAKFIYSQTFVPGGGSAGRTNCDLVTNKGWGDEILTPSYDMGVPPSETFMERPQDITLEAFKDAFLDRALSYAIVDININTIAQAIRDNKGCIIGISGKNNGTWSTKFPVPPPDTTDVWRHWMYCGKAKTINGKRMIGALNSWGETTGEQGWQWFDENYIKEPFVWSCWTMVYFFPLFKFTKNMRFGSVGNEVEQLQKRLGLYQDGIFGWRTRGAVKAYQLSHGLVPDGIVGPLTRTVLNK